MQLYTTAMIQRLERALLDSEYHGVIAAYRTSSFLQQRAMLCLCAFFAAVSLVAAIGDDYWQERDALIQNETSYMVGSALILSAEEQIVNEKLMSLKHKEYDGWFAAPSKFAPGKHFFEGRRDVEQSEVFKFIQRMPKGAVLHGHDTALASQEFLYNLTFRDNLYSCVKNGRLLFRFLKSPNQEKSCNWILVSESRSNNASFDSWLRSQMTLVVENPREVYTNINVVWKRFKETFATINSMILYKPIFEEHFYQALQELYEDNVIYLEFRGTLPTVYDLDGNEYGPVEVAGLYEQVIEQFKHDNLHFFGARLIYGPNRNVNNETASEYVQTVINLKKKYPQLLAGFDLVGQEDLGKPLVDFLHQLQSISLNFFFHAGETDWYGTTSDFNLVDAILLGTQRIGHGYALQKHPLLMKMVKEKHIAIEVCPISNQVLLLVDDLRNHPAASFIAQGMPVVISYDDPGFWGAKGLSYDFYMAFMGIASRNADLKLLKQLAMNSLTYSAIPSDQKQEALLEWQEQWIKFIHAELENMFGYTISVINVK